MYDGVIFGVFGSTRVQKYGKTNGLVSDNCNITQVLQMKKKNPFMIKVMHCFTVLKEELLRTEAKLDISKS